LSIFTATTGWVETANPVSGSEGFGFGFGLGFGFGFGLGVVVDDDVVVDVVELDVVDVVVLGSVVLFISEELLLVGVDELDAEVDSTADWLPLLVQPARTRARHTKAAAGRTPRRTLISIAKPFIAGHHLILIAHRQTGRAGSTVKHQDGRYGRDAPDRGGPDPAIMAGFGRFGAGQAATGTPGAAAGGIPFWPRSTSSK
jgi:hypothetical protein